MSTFYAPQTWADGSAGNTPVTATALGHIESGVGSAHDRIDALTVGTVLIPTAIRTAATAPTAGQLVTYDASSGSIGPIPLPPPAAGVIMAVVKGDSTSNTVTLTSGVLLGNGGSTNLVLRTVGEQRTLYGSASGWFVLGLHAPVVGTTAGTFAAGDDARFSNTLAAALYGGSSRTQAPVCEVTYTGTSFGVSGASDIFAQGGWAATGANTDSMLGTAGSFAVINIPVNGRYEMSYRCALTPTITTFTKASIVRNSPTTTNTVAVDIKSANTADLVTLNAFGSTALAAGDQLYWGNYTRNGSITVTKGGTGTGFAPTGITVRYVGPN